MLIFLSADSLFIGVYDIEIVDVISLGKDHAINLGVDYDNVVKKMIVVVAVLLPMINSFSWTNNILGLLVTILSK